MTLLEILVAMVILSLGATGLIALFASASSTHKRSVDRTHSALVAEEIFSEVQALYVHGVAPEDLLADLHGRLPERIRDAFWEVTLHRPGHRPGPRPGHSPGPGAGKSKAFTPEEETGLWSGDELIVHVVIRWSAVAGARQEPYTTILLPRPGR